RRGAVRVSVRMRRTAYYGTYFDAVFAGGATVTIALTFEYCSLVRMFFDSSSVRLLNGRAAMILSAVASSTPGSFMRSSLVAVLRSVFGCAGLELCVDE